MLRGRPPKSTRSRWRIWGRVAAAGCTPADAARGATTGQARTTRSPEPAPEASNERLRGCYPLAGPSPPLDAYTPAERVKLTGDPLNPPGTMRKVGPSLRRISAGTCGRKTGIGGP